MNALTDLDDRLRALERKAITVADLPMAALKLKLESDWKPDPGLLLGTSPARGGIDEFNFATLTLSDDLIVSHGLNRLPLAVVATAFSAPAVDNIPLLNTFTWTDTTFTIQGEVDVAYTGTIQFCWVAL